MFITGSVLPVKIQPALLRPLAYRVLSKKYGLNIKSDGLAALAEFVGKTFGMDWKKNGVTLQFLEKFAIVWRQQERGVFIDEQGVKDVVSEMREREKVTAVTEEGNRNANNPNENQLIKKQKQGTLDLLINAPPLASTGTEGETTETESVNRKLGLSETPSDQSHEDTEAENEERLDWEDYFKVINASEQPKCSYDTRKLQFNFTLASSRQENEIHALKLPPISSDISIFLTRFYLVRDRIQRNENFQANDTFNPLSSIIAMKHDLTASEVVNKIPVSMSITQIKNLAGRDGHDFLLLGLLSRNTKGNWSLEDPSGTIEIDISQTRPTEGLYYVPGCIVLVEGIYFTVGNRFHVSSMTHPPGEKRETTLEAIGNLDLLGIHGQSNSNFVPRLDMDLKIRLHLLEKELVDHRFVFFGGDIFLDDMTTLDALRRVLTKLNDDPPTLIVLQGSFSAFPVHASMSSRSVSSTTQYKANFDRLAVLLSDLENIAEHSTLVLIPGNNDPWGSMVSLGAAHAWPLHPVPSFFTQKVQKVCKRVVLASNPARLAYLSQEIVIVRDDMTDRFKRHSVTFPVVEERERGAYLDAQNCLKKETKNKTGNVSRGKDQLPLRVKESRKLIKTLLDQGQLSPFMASTRPLVWNLEQALDMYPVPSTLILCDTTAPQFDITYNGCKAINLGKFIVGRKARYIEYKPSLKKASQEELFF